MTKKNRTRVKHLRNDSHMGIHVFGGAHEEYLESKGEKLLPDPKTLRFNHYKHWWNEPKINGIVKELPHFNDTKLKKYGFIDAFQKVVFQKKQQLEEYLATEDNVN